MTHAIKAGSTDQIAYFRAYDTDGSAKVDLTSATTGLSLSVFRIGASAVSISSLSDKAADNTTHSDGAIRQVQGNLYTIDLPDAAQATQVSSISVKGTYTGGVIEGVPHPIVGYDGTAARVGASDGTGVTLAADQAVNVTKVGGEAITQSGGRMEVNTTHFGGTAGTFSSGRPEVNTTHWAGTAVGSVTLNCNMTQISGDAVAADNLEAALDGTGGVTITASLTGNITGNLSGSVGDVTAGVTVLTNNDKAGYSLSQSFPTHFASMQIAANGHVSSVVESIANNSITASAIQGDAITAAKIAADAVTKIQSGLATPADVNAEVLDVLTTDTFAELSAVPAATSSLKDKLTWLFQWLRNKSTQTSTQRKLYADDGTTVVSTETVSDDGTTYTKGEAS